MTRLGYVIIAIAIAALAAYVFWPTAPEGDSIERVWPGGTVFPDRYRVRLGELRQEVDVPRVTVQGVDRPLDPGLHERLWNRVRILGAPRDRVVRDVKPEQLAAYGITEERRLDCDAIVLGWARSGTGGYVWEGRSRRILAVDQETVQALDQAAGRLDDQALVAGSLACRAVVVDGVTLAKDAEGRWRDQANPFRPPFDQRLNDLLHLVREVRLERFDLTMPAEATPVGVVALSTSDGATHHITVAVQRDMGWLQVRGQPPQRLDALALTAWRMCFTDLRSDMLFDIGLRVVDSPLVEVTALRAGRRLFRLEKHGINDVDRDGASRWDVTWDGGRETADGDAAALLAQDCDRLRVTQVAVRGGAPEPADAVVIEFVFSARHDRLRAVLVPLADGGWEAWSPTHRGRVDGPLSPRLADPTPDACLDTALSHRPAFRVAKLQRRMSAGTEGAGEVFVCEQGQGAWRRTWPQAEARRPVNQLAVDRLVRALCTARGLAVRLIKAEDRRIIAQPDFSVAMRFVPVVEPRSEDGVRLGDTTDQDWQLAFGRGADGWRAVDRDAGVSWLLDGELVAILQQPLGDDLAFPIMASLVQRVDITGPLGRQRLVREEGRWRQTVFDRDGGSRQQLADEVAVRSYLRALAGLKARRRSGTGPIPADQVLGTVVCEMPDVGDEKAQAVLTVGRPVDGLVPVAAISSRDDHHLGNDRMLVGEAEAAILLPAPSAFAVADAPR